MSKIQRFAGDLIGEDYADLTILNEYPEEEE